MKLLRIATLATGMFLTSAYVEGDEPKAAKTANERKAAIEKFLPTTEKKEHELINQTSTYLARELMKRESLDPILDATEKLRAELKEKIKAQKHAYMDVPIEHNGRPDAVDNLSKGQLLRISLLMDDLLNGNLLEEIGKILESAEEGKEAGGVVLIKDGKVFFKALPSAGEKPLSFQFAASYTFSDDSYKEPHLFIFHTHPHIKGQGNENSPSWDIKGSRYGVSMSGDLGVAKGLAKTFGESHQIVISVVGKPEEKTFNVDYFGAEHLRYKAPETAFDPNTSHMNVLDLGVWTYKGESVKDRASP